MRLTLDELLEFEPPAFNANERAAIEAAVPRWIEGNTYCTMDESRRRNVKPEQSAADVLAGFGIAWGYSRDTRAGYVVKFCDIEREVRTRGWLALRMSRGGKRERKKVVKHQGKRR